MPLQGIPAHYGGSQVFLDEDILRLSEESLAAAYTDGEVEYSEADLAR